MIDRVDADLAFGGIGMRTRARLGTARIRLDEGTMMVLSRWEDEGGAIGIATEPAWIVEIDDAGMLLGRWAFAEAARRAREWNAEKHEGAT